MLSEKTIILPHPDFQKKATIYYDAAIPAKAHLLYFHGGGLLYGSRTDLPMLHKDLLTKAGYSIIAFDYPLAPSMDLSQILQDVNSSIHHYISSPDSYGDKDVPYFLWGRSSGAYLCLMTAAKGSFPKQPSGIISFYGYGFLCDKWFLEASPHYRKFPTAAFPLPDASEKAFLTDAPKERFYSRYVYARQNGTWLDLIYHGRQKYFYLEYTLRTCDSLSCPLFCAHSTQDPDVPYAEFQELYSKYHCNRFIASSAEHDFDRNTDSPITQRLLEAMIDFGNQQLLSL